ncbi:MAG: fructose-6-phosphate aldolase [Acidobacteriota bacterium]
MKIFIDTANLKEIREAESLGVLDGVTTNPSLLAKEGTEPIALLKEICRIVRGPVSAEVLAVESREMIAEAHELAALADNIVVKVPIGHEGLKAVKALFESGIKTNVTLTFSATQALLAAKAGATYVSPFIGRLDDISTDGMKLVEEIRTIYNNYDFSTQILAASLRHPMHVLQAAMVGADAATIPYKVIMSLLDHPLTTIGIERFLSDYKKAYGDTKIKL